MRPASLPFDDREVERGAAVNPSETAEAKLRLAAELAGGPLGHDLHRAADRVLAEERALRSAQHLDALDVEQFEHRARRAGEVDVVDVDADARILGDDEVGLADAAEEDLREVAAAAAVARVRELHVRRRVGDAAKVAHAQLAERFAAERRNRDRHVLQVLFAPPRRDDDRLLDAFEAEHHIVERAILAGANLDAGGFGASQSGKRDGEGVGAGGHAGEDESPVGIGHRPPRIARRIVDERHVRSGHHEARLINGAASQLAAGRRLRRRGPDCDRT